jgi:hypothetical protein
VSSSSEATVVTKEEVDAAIAALESWGRSVDTWVLICAAVVAIFLAAEAAFGVAHWLNERQLRPLRAEQARLHELEIVGLNKQIAELNNETARLKKKMGPRSIDGDTFIKALEGKAKSPVEIMFPKENPEAFMLANQIRELLRIAKWEAAVPAPVPPTDIPRLANQPSHMAAGAQPFGVAVVIRADTQEEFNRSSDFKADTPMNALRDAFAKTLGDVAGYAGGPDIFPAPPVGVVRIVVGPKP